MCWNTNAIFSFTSLVNERWLSSPPELWDEDMNDDNITMWNGPRLEIVQSHLQHNIPGASNRFYLPDYPWGRAQIEIRNWNLGEISKHFLTICCVINVFIKHWLPGFKCNSLLLPIIMPLWERFTTSKENLSSAVRMSKKTSVASERGVGLSAATVRRKTISVERIDSKFLLVW